MHSVVLWAAAFSDLILAADRVEWLWVSVWSIHTEQRPSATVNRTLISVAWSQVPGALLQHFRTRQAPGMFTLQCQEFTESRGEQKNSSSQLPPCWIKALQKDVARLPDKPPSLHRKSCEGRLLKFIGYSNRGGQSGHTSSKLDSWRV